jgi:hypothetical protein
VGLWLGHRPVNVLFVPGVLVLLWAVGGQDKVWSHLRVIVCGGVLALLPFLYLPIASAADPPIDVGDPQTWDRFWTVVTSQTYHRHLEDNTFALVIGRLGLYATLLPRELGAGLIAAIVGGVVLLRQSPPARRLATAFLLVAGVNLAFAANYNIADIEVYFVPSTVALALLGAFGAQHVLDKISSSAVLVLVMGAIGLPVNYAANDLSEHRFTRRLGEDLLDSVPDNALLFVNGDMTIHTLWYLQAVEKRAPNVLVFSMGHIWDWHLEQLKARFPQDDWPGGVSAIQDPGLVTDRLGRSRPVHLDLSVARDVVLKARDGVRYETFSRGLTLEALRTGSRLNLRERGVWNLRFLEQAKARLGPLPDHIDMDTKSVFIQYAIAFHTTGEMLARARERSLALKAFGQVDDFSPDRHEASIQEEVRLRLGETIPAYRWGEQARQAMARLAQAQPRKPAL